MAYGSFFCFIVSGILFILYSPQLPFNVLMAAGLPISSLGIVLLKTANPGYKRKGLYCIALFLGLCTGNYLQLLIQQTEQTWFKAYKDVGSFTCTVYKDSVFSAKSGFIHYVKLNSVISETGNYRAAATGNVLVLDPGNKRCYAGQLLEIRAKLRKTDEDREIHFICYAAKGAVTEQGFSFPVYKIRYGMLRYLSGQINELGYPAASLFNALFLGAKEDLPGELNTAFKNTGTLHILAVSGLHVGIIYMLITLLLFPIPSKKLKIIIGSLLVLFYLFLVGPVASLQRAAFMLILLAINRFLYRAEQPMNILAISAFIILIIDPQAAYSISFQLSFLAMAGIFLAGDKLSRLFSAYIPQVILMPLACSIGAQLTTAPVVLINFQVIYLSGIIVTLLLVPLVTAFTWIGILFLVLNLFRIPFISYIGSLVMNLLYSVIAAITDFFAYVPGISLQWQPWYWLVFLAILALFVVKVRKRRIIPEI